METQLRLSALTLPQCQELYSAACTVLQDTGVSVLDERIVDLLRTHGARVEGERVCLPGALIEQARASAPSAFTLYGRDAGRAKYLTIRPGHIHYGPSITAPYLLDPSSGERRPFCHQDSQTVARICEALPHIDYVAGFGFISDAPETLAEVVEFATLLANSTKPLMAWSNTLAGCEEIHRLAAAVSGDEETLLDHPSYFFLGCSISPLIIPGEVCAQLRYCAGHRVPFVFGPCPMCGANTPATLASALVVASAESLAALVISQLVMPGTPFIMGGSLSTIDMRTMVMPYGAPELALLCSAETELAHFIGVPAWSTGGVSDAKLIDEQAALEGAMSILTAGLSGADLIHNVGFLEGCKTGSLEYLVLMDEAIGWAKRVLRGIDISPETLAVELIGDAGPGGSFLSTEHTLRHFKTEFWFPSLLDRQPHDRWRRSGGKTTQQRVQDKLNKLLDVAGPAPLPREAQARVDRVLAAAQERLS